MAMLILHQHQQVIQPNGNVPMPTRTSQLRRQKHLHINSHNQCDNHHRLSEISIADVLASPPPHGLATSTPNLSLGMILIDNWTTTNNIFV
jgi:hypothetical protein